MLPKQLVSLVSSQLSSVYDTEESKAIAFELIGFYSGLSKNAVLRNQHELSMDALEKVHAAIPRLLANEPLQYILGQAWFCGLPFTVNNQVLIPRPETEELVSLVLAACTQLQLHAPTILDIGTGSGCIPITLKKKIPQATVFGLDISDGALAVARQNAKQLEVAVTFLEADILNSQNIHLPPLDIIVSNPPYITNIEKLEMSPNVLSFEPHGALFVTDGNPMQFYDAIASFAIRQLKPGGLLMVEINRLFAKEVQQTIENLGFKQVVVHTDMHGNQRMVSCKKALYSSL